MRKENPGCACNTTGANVIQAVRLNPRLTTGFYLRISRKAKADSVIASVCQHARHRRMGKTPAGSIRYRCKDCGKTWTDSTAMFDGMTIGMDRAACVIRHLCEGTSVRATSRLCGMDVNTILDLLTLVGARCKRFLFEQMKKADVYEVQADEIWGFVGMKQKTANRLNLQDEPVGDVYCYTAVERFTKLLLCYQLGKRNDRTTDLFVERLQLTSGGAFHLSTDGFVCYPQSVLRFFGYSINYGRIIKIYGSQTEEDRRKYSPPAIKSIEREFIMGGQEAADRACTSHVERHNGTIRTFTRRMTRLTNGFSKKLANHDAALGLFFCYYNFCWPHKSLSVKGMKRTPAMAAILTDHVWTVPELLEKIAAS
jgi:IS1 family transposase/transposase-like protein